MLPTILKMKLTNYILTFIGFNIISYVYSFDNNSLLNNEQIELIVRRLENNLEYAKILNENINFIDLTWKNKMNSIKHLYENVPINKQNIIDNVLGYGEYIKQKIIYNTFYNYGFFFDNDKIIKINLGKLKLIETTHNKKNNFDYNFFDKNYLMYYNNWSIIVNKIYIFKLQNQNRLNKIFELYLVYNYESLEKNIFNQVFVLTNDLVRELSIS